MIQRMRSHIQAAEMDFLRRVAGIFRSDKVRSSVIYEGNGVEPLLFALKGASRGGSGIW